MHFCKLIFRWFLCGLARTLLSTSRCFSWVSVCTRRSLMCTSTLKVSGSTPSMSLWKLAREPRSPMGDVIQWNWPLPRIVKAVSFWESLSSCIFQEPEVRSPRLWICWSLHWKFCQCTLWFPSWSICQYVSSSLAHGNLEQSWVLGPVLFEHRNWVSYRGS